MSWRETMGDMRTPDFDDLLAAFDIPDIVDTKAAIESGQVDHEDHIQPTNIAITTQDELQIAQEVGNSVIVKNTQNKVKEPWGSPSLSTTNQNELHNSSVPSVNNHNKKDRRPPNDCRRTALNNTASMVNTFSPISSAEESDEEGKIDIDEESNTCVTQKHKQPDPLVSESHFTKEIQQNSVKNDQNNNSLVDVEFQIPPKNNMQKKQLKEYVSKTEELKKTDESSRPVCVSNMTVDDLTSKTSDNLFTSIAAIAVLRAQKDTAEIYETIDSLQSEKDPVLVNSHQDDSCATSKRTDSNEAQKILLTKPPENPSGFTRGTSSMSFDKQNQDIPKVCINTVKTKSGQIKGAITKVSSEVMKETGISRKYGFMGNKCEIFSSPGHLLPTTEDAKAAEFGNDVTKPMTIKPVATAFLPMSVVKGTGSQVINLKLANNTTVKATVIPSSSMKSMNGGILKTANGIKQQALMVPTSNLVNSKLQKTVHLGNLNLLPQTMASSICKQQTFTLSLKHQQKQQQLKTIFGGQTSKKLSKVQVFESSQNSEVDAFNKVLSSTNPVPIYVPNLSPPSSLCITLPSNGHKCLECGDSFALQRSLMHHYERRSVRIDVTCNQCTKSLVFYNKCSLMSHARGHKDKGIVMQCTQLILKPIPVDQMVITSSPTGTCETPTFNSQTSWSGSQNLLCALIPEDEQSTQGRQSLVCWECKEMFENISSLAVHYQQESNGQKACAVCQMVLPNQCSFLSHQRIHKHKSPFICPECGINCYSVNFQSHHVTNTCLHYSRCNGYRCVHCSVILPDVSTLKSHIQSSHCEIFYKCPICPMAFKSAPGTHSHSYTQHPGMKAGEPRLIYKCAMCDTVFTLQSLLYTHLEQHVSTYRTPVYKCPDCSLYYAQKQLMLDHIKTIHGALKTVEVPPVPINLPLSTRSTNSSSPCSNSNNIKDSDNEKLHARHDKHLPESKTVKWNSQKEFKSKSRNGYICLDCNTDFLCREVYVGHMRKEHHKILKKHPCHHCEMSFCSARSLCRHNRLKHKVFTCPKCPTLSQLFTKRVLLEQHIQLVHGDQKRKIVKTNIMETTSDKQMTYSKPNTEDDEASVSLNCRSPDPQPLKKLKVNITKDQKCAICNFSTTSIGAFHEHIPLHKLNGSSYQCKECGLCFTSPRSLSRHLFIVHRLKEPHGLSHYLKRNGGCDETQQENQLNSADENDDDSPKTKCKVCSREFETEAILNTHMRTHGMAFIKAKASKVKAEKRLTLT